MRRRHYKLMNVFTVILQSVLSIQLPILHGEVVTHTQDLFNGVFVGSFSQSRSLKDLPRLWSSKPLNNWQESGVFSLLLSPIRDVHPGLYLADEGSKLNGQFPLFFMGRSAFRAP